MRTHTLTTAIVGLTLALSSRDTQAQCTVRVKDKAIALDAADRDHFGYSVALCGDTAIVGSPEDDHSTALDAGSAHVFVRSGGVWLHRATLIAPDSADKDLFGYSVTLIGDTAAIGAPYDDHSGMTDAGSVYLFRRSNGGWSHEATLTAANPQNETYFGRCLAISGNSLLVGACYGSNCSDIIPGVELIGPSAAYVFVHSGNNWIQQSKLTSPQGGYGWDSFGYSVSLDGDTAVIGAPDRDVTDLIPQRLAAGTVYVFKRSGESWGLQQALSAPDAEQYEQFGCSVSISGDTILVGNCNSRLGTVFQAGSVYAFVQSAGAWVQQAKLTASEPIDGAEFGNSVTLQGDEAVIGSYLEVPPDVGLSVYTGADLNEIGIGAAYVFVRSGALWEQRARLVRYGQFHIDRFGRSVSLSGSTVLIGAYYESRDEREEAGSAFISGITCDNSEEQRGASETPSCFPFGCSTIAVTSIGLFALKRANSNS